MNPTARKTSQIREGIMPKRLILRALLWFTKDVGLSEMAPLSQFCSGNWTMKFAFEGAERLEYGHSRTGWAALFRRHEGFLAVYNRFSKGGILP